jgi:hypothetical protein
LVKRGNSGADVDVVIQDTPERCNAIGAKNEVLQAAAVLISRGLICQRTSYESPDSLGRGRASSTSDFWSN